MVNINDCFCVILAGGKGRRLWPCSREKKPKQFMDFFSTGRTLLQATYDRMQKLVPKENILVSTNRAYIEYVREQLPEMQPENMLNEPVHRNTAASAAWGNFRIEHRNPNACVVIVPSDQMVFNEEKYLENLREGLDIVSESDLILTMGVRPTRPEPGYGYIQMGDQKIGHEVYSVKSFTEKPAREFAQMFMDSGEFLWNTGIYLSNVRNLRLCLRKIFPAVLSLLEERQSEVSYEDDVAFMEEHFAAYPNISIDSGLLEQNDNGFVMKCDFGWADLGMWHSIYESFMKGPGDNVVIDSKVMTEDCKGNIIKLPKDHLGIIQGLEGFIVAEEGNVLLICKKGDSSALVRKFVSEVQMNYGDEYI